MDSLNYLSMTISDFRKQFEAAASMLHNVEDIILNSGIQHECLKNARTRVAEARFHLMHFNILYDKANK